jgi:two-component system phosphate regulon response regulator PhoB
MRINPTMLPAHACAESLLVASSDVRIGANHCVAAVATPLRIVLIEDDESIVELLRYNFEAAGFAVEWIRNGSHALAQLTRNPPGFVVIDWGIPGLSGIEVVRQLRACTATARLPIIMVTGRSEARDQRLALQIGVDGFMVKPFAVGILMAEIDELLRIRHAR